MGTKVDLQSRELETASVGQRAGDMIRGMVRGGGEKGDTVWRRRLATQHCWQQQET